MTIEKSTVFESFLIRGDGKGGLQAAHVEYLELIKDGDDVLSSKILPAQPLGITPKELAPVLGAALTAALETNEAQAAEIATLTAAKTEAEAARDQALANVAALTEQLAAMQPPTDANGVPQVVSMVQAQLALLGAGLLDKVEAAIASIPGDQGRAAQIEWSKAANVHRDHALIAGMQDALKLSDAQIDALFIDAAKR